MKATRTPTAPAPATGKANASPTSRWRLGRKIGVIAWLALAIVTVVFYVQPVRSQSVRWELLLGSSLLWLGALALIRQKTCHRLGLTLPLLAGALLLLPGRATDPSVLRRQYVSALSTYQGTPYVWGGETGRGIDCSGLIRAGLIDAQRAHGLATANPAAVRQSFSLAWHDCSAKAMRDEYRGYTRVLFTAPSINAIDHSRILPGDFVVTSNGVHTLAYIGNHTWIEADPGTTVITLRVGDNNPWLKMPVHVLRWSQLEPR